VSVEEIYDISVLDAEKYYVYGSDTGIMPGDVIYPYIVKTKCSVTEENQYFCNGFNYMFMVLTKQNGKIGGRWTRSCPMCISTTKGKINIHS
jgi:hypothetical protein